MNNYIIRLIIREIRIVLVEHNRRSRTENTMNSWLSVGRAVSIGRAAPWPNNRICQLRNSD